MSRDTAIQFAIVREDPLTELAVVDALLPGPRRVLLVASGGCTALSLGVLRPELSLTVLDANRAQLDLVAWKYRSLQALPPGSAERDAAFGAAVDDDASFSGCGNFERLFRGLRGVLDDLVMRRQDRASLLEMGGDPRELIEHRFWPVAFSMFFSDPMLETMFGRDATQHAPRGSYPGYFQRVIEAGLRRDDVARNPYLHHVLLGHWLEASRPIYLDAPAPALPPLLHTTMQAAPSFADFDLVQLSNLFDWMADDVIDVIVARLCAECPPGAVVLLRQLNNRRPVEERFATMSGGSFQVRQELSQAVTTADRSLFYERIVVLQKALQKAPA